MTAILDLPDWGEVRIWVGSRPLTSQELIQAYRIINDFLIDWQAQSVAWLRNTPVIAECEVFANQAFAFGYAALRRQDRVSGDSQPFYMTGSDIDPLIDAMDTFARQQTPYLDIGSDDAIIVDEVMSPMSKTARRLAHQGRVSGKTLVMTGGPIKRWRRLGPIHPLRDDRELFTTFKNAFAKQGIELLDE